MFTVKIIREILMAFGGVAVFLFGLQKMSECVQAVAGEKMKQTIYGATRSKLRGILAGAGVTAIIQSSTATNIMLASFAGAGAITFKAAIPVIMGANIGTTITAQLVSLSGGGFSLMDSIASLFAVAGFVLTFFKKDLVKNAGGFLFGFGLLFIGLGIMNERVSAFGRYPFFRGLFTVKNPFFLILNGFLITGIVQSSSAVSSVIIALAASGILGFESCAYLILGSNIGSGVAVLLLSSSIDKEAEKVAMANILFNLFGTAIVLPFLICFAKPIENAFFAFSGSAERMVANFHTVFNILSTILLLPLCGVIKTATEFLCRERNSIRAKIYKSKPARVKP